MSEELLTEKYAEQLQGVLECYDRVIILGHLGPLSYAQGMTCYLNGQHIRIFDYSQFTEPLRDEIKARIAEVAQENGVQIEYIGKKSWRKSGSKKSFGNAAKRPGWCIFFRRWNHARATSPGMTRARAKPI